MLCVRDDNDSFHISYTPNSRILRFPRELNRSKLERRRRIKAHTKIKECGIKAHNRKKHKTKEETKGTHK